MIPNPTMIAASLVAAIALFMSGLGVGIKWESGRNAEAQVKAQNEYQTKYQEAIDHGNALAEKLAIEQGIIHTRTVTVIKNIPGVTDDKPCLSPDALRLLNGSDATGMPETGGESISKTYRNLAATDRDIANWIADAQDQYGQCAKQLNALIDFETTE